MNGTRLARNASAAVVAGIAAWSSYSHMVHVALRFGERPEVAWLLPFSVDGMLVVASVAMVDDKRSSRRVRPMARVAFAAGVAASIAANIAAAEPTWGARVVAAWPALALLLVVEMLSRSGHSHTATQPSRPTREPRNRRRHPPWPRKFRNNTGRRTLTPWFRRRFRSRTWQRFRSALGRPGRRATAATTRTAHADRRA